MRIQIEKLKKQLQGPGRGIHDEKTMAAMLKTPRHLFIPPAQRKHAYEDFPLPIGYGQTISQPYMVALMTQILNPQRTESILEIGTGSGYQTAILATLACKVYTIECCEPLIHHAQCVLDQLDHRNIHFRQGNGHEGWAQAAPFDGILIACAPPCVPWRLTRQLTPTGRMIVPVGNGKHQALKHITCKAGRWSEQNLMPVRFVPMTEKG